MAKDDEIPFKEAEGSGLSRSMPLDQSKRMQEEARKARVAAKLRENLQRRKSQARARRAGDADQATGLPAAKTDESS